MKRTSWKGKRCNTKTVRSLLKRCQADPQLICTSTGDTLILRVDNRPEGGDLEYWELTMRARWR